MFPMLHDPSFPLWQGPYGIRPFHAGEAEAFVEAVLESVPELAPWMPWVHADYSVGAARFWIDEGRAAFEANRKHEFAVVDRAGRLLGGCGLSERNDLHRTANLGYWVRTSAAGKGVATAAARRVAVFGFEVLRLQRIEILILARNTASLRVAEKLGAPREGVLRNRLRIREAPMDAVMHALVPEDLGLVCR
jgi:RimJ/RimL family protein N-acetyltransferase